MLFFLLVSILTINLNEANAQLSQIHFGSSHTPLSGLTLTWQNTAVGDSIKWGYTMQLENGVFVPESRSYKSNYLSDFTFPVVIADTIVYYSLFDASNKTWTDLMQFKTAKPNGAPFSFTAMGDSRTNMADWQKVANAVLPTDFTLFMGDIVGRGDNVAEWDAWFNYGQQFLNYNVVYHTLGNHDVGLLDSTANYSNLFVQPKAYDNNELYYSFNYGNAVFICLNSERPADTVQYNWLLQTLEQNKNTTWKIIWFHKPFFTSPVHAADMNNYRNTWWKAFDDYSVDLIFNGHTHNYQCTVPINLNVANDTAVETYGNCPQNGRCQIVTGAAGAPLYGEGTGWFINNSYSGLHFVDVRVFDDSLVIKALTPDYHAIDSFTLVKNFTPKIECSDSQICNGDEVTLTATGADSLIWIPEIENGTAFKPSETTEISLIASNRYGCIDTLNINIEVLPVYFLTDTIKICTGDSLFWQSMYYKTQGVYYANYNTMLLCDSVYELVLATQPLPYGFEIQGNANVVEGSEVIYQVQNTLNFSYSWEVRGGVIVNQISDFVVQIRWETPGEGQIKVNALNEYGCNNSVSLAVNVENTIGVKQILQTNYLIENAEQKSINVTYAKLFKVEIYTLQGIKIIESKNTNILLNSLKQGLYLAVLKDANNVVLQIKKLIIN